MSVLHFASPQEAQAAFYEAIERADLAQMMTVWAGENDIVCIHPGGDRHTGIEQVRESWRQIFARGPELKFKLLDECAYPGRTVAVHNVHEHITHTQAAFAPTTVVATNVFVLSNHGWHLLVHHASQFPQQRTEELASSTLH
jgi:ketosteroid isomerase-like protein